jgi:preprotein translocase subunit Sec61beta
MFMVGELFLPSGSGGLMRYNQEYASNFMLKPSHVVLFVIGIVVVVAVMKIFFPIA